MLSFLVLGFVLTVNGIPHRHPSSLDGRIVGGRPTTIEEFPYQVSLHYFGFFNCGGSIISPTFVITAGHCTHEIPDVSLSVRVASNSTENDGQEIPVKKVHRNPSFDIETMDYDISILELYYAIKLGPSALPIPLASKGFEISSGTNVVVTGWGTLSEGGAVATRLQVVEIPFISNEDCQKAYAKSEIISERMMCAQAEIGGKDACQGDSGGPLVVDGVLVGIVSWGYGCARPEYPGVYSRISKFRDFINEVTQL